MKMGFFYLASTIMAGTYGLTFLFPTLFASFGGNEKDVGNTFAVIALSTLSALLFSGYIVRMFGHMYTIALSSALVCASLVMYAVLSQMSLLVYLGGVGIGVGYGLFYVLTPIVIAQNTPEEQRVKHFTLFSVFIMIGLGLLPVLNYWLESQGQQTAMSFLIVGLGCLFSAGIYLYQVRSFAIAQNNDQRLSLHDIRRVLRSRAVIPITMVLLGASVFAGVTNFQVTYASDNGLDYVTYFLVYTAVVVVCRLFFSTVTDKFHPYTAITALLFVMFASVQLFILADGNTNIYWAASLLFGIGYGVSYPIIKAVASLEAEPEIFEQTMQVLC